HHIHVLSFSLKTQRQPCSTLFPYTTLFRSSGSATRTWKAGLPSAHLASQLSRRSNGSPSTIRSSRQLCTDGKRGRITTPRLSSTDRKSTRLNSSHLGISYAVFCLKKKKKNT